MLSRATPTAPGARLGLLALLLYVSVDCANPMMAGAVCFDPDTCVEAVTHARALPSAGTANTAPAATIASAAVALGRLVRRPGVSPSSGAGAEVAQRPRARLAPVGETSPEDD
ncbi:MAG TPA: hypothetical protein VGD07_01035 [Methylomirabilota bacterium]